MMFSIEELVAMVRMSVDIDSDVNTTYRTRGPWLEVIEATETEGWVYWVRRNNLSAKGYDVVEHPNEDPDQMDLDLMFHFPK